MTESTREAMRTWLEENPSVRADICREINSYDGSMDFTEVFEDIESAIEELDLDAVEAARMTFLVMLETGIMLFTLMHMVILRMLVQMHRAISKKPVKITLTKS